MNSPQETNRLKDEKSPYLLQHADNPVHWFPWSDEAFEQAKARNKPVLLSIGYSTCHWCHVMAHESFENESIARMMNDYFVCVKVDREERPDVDHIYMSAVQSMTGQGGWPLTVFLTPDRKPFFGGTYFPPYEKWGTPGLPQLMESIHAMWKQDPQKILESSELIAGHLEREKSTEEGENVSPKILDQAADQYKRQFDSTWGGFGTAPKFPSSHNLSFLLRRWSVTGNEELRDIVEVTLNKMSSGGMMDHLGGGYHRYSTDKEWLVPHFEKMLYDQALLVTTLAEAYQVTGNERYASLIRMTMDYVIREMQSPGGGYYSAQDADSIDPYEQGPEKKEGAFYLWTFDHLQTLLGEAFDVFRYRYGVEENGNAKNDPHAEMTGKNILFEARTLEETAKHFRVPIEQVDEKLRLAKKRLWEEREKRTKPHLDDKVLVDWNGLMIAAAAMAGRVLDDDRYIDSAKKAANFILQNMKTSDGRLRHRFREGESAIEGLLSDYAFLAHGLMELYRATSDGSYLAQVFSLAQIMLDDFEDKGNGGFFMAGSRAADLIVRPKEIYDGAYPSGNAMAAMVLYRLSVITGEAQWGKSLEKLFQTFRGDIQQYPTGYSYLLSVIEAYLRPSRQIVVCRGSNDIKPFLRNIESRYLPDSFLSVLDGSQPSRELRQRVAILQEKVPVEGKTAVYVCQGQTCQAPVTDSEKLDGVLDLIEKGSLKADHSN